METTPAVKPAVISTTEGGSLWSCPGCGYVRGIKIARFEHWYDAMGGLQGGGRVEEVRILGERDVDIDLSADRV